MKIVYMITNIKNCGPFSVIRGLLDNINEEKYIISLFGNDDKKVVKELEDNGIKVINLNLSKSNIFIKGSKILQKTLDKFEPNVVHSHGLLPDYLLSKVSNYYKVTTIHNNPYEDYIFNFGLMGKFWIWFHLRHLKNFDRVICCSKTVYNVINKKVDNCIFICNGINIESYDKETTRKNVRNRLGLKSTDIVYVYAGVLSNIKKVLTLIDNFNANHEENEYLIILGDGPLKNECIEKKGTNILMLGYQNNVIDYYLASDIYISASCSEGFSMSILEALSAGNLLLLSNIPSHNEMINLESSIYLGETFDKNNFKEKKKKVCLKLKENNVLEICDIISAKKMADLYLTEYKVGE